MKFGSNQGFFLTADASKTAIGTRYGVRPAKRDKEEAVNWVLSCPDGARFQVKRIIDDWIGIYNSERPHTALDKRTPDKAFLKRLKEKSKPHKVVLIALARKLIVTANTLVAKTSFGAQVEIQLLGIR